MAPILIALNVQWRNGRGDKMEEEAMIWADIDPQLQQEVLDTLFKLAEKAGSVKLTEAFEAAYDELECWRNATLIEEEPSAKRKLPGWM
jgi:hypothetical protein